MTKILLISIVIMIFIIIFQISKASEYVSVLKGEEKSRKQNNRINAFLLIVFLVLGLIGCWWCNNLYYGKTLFVQGAASEMGEKIDLMLYITIAVTGLVFFATQILLFWFASDTKSKSRHNKLKKRLLLVTTISVFASFTLTALF